MLVAENGTSSKKSAMTMKKSVLSLNTGIDSSYDGIKSINLIDWLIYRIKTEYTERNQR